MDTVSPCYIYGYNELEQLHMQVLLNCHLATFLYSPLKFWKVAKQQLNNIFMCNYSSSL